MPDIWFSKDMTSFFEFFQRQAKRFATNDFLHIPAIAAREYATSAVDLTYESASTAVDQLRQAYASAGFGSTHRVAVMLDNRVECFLHLLALNSVGASLVPIGSALRPEEAAFQLDHSEAALLVVAPERERNARAAVDAAKANVPIIVDARPSELPKVAPSTGEQTIGQGTEAALLYTSGTTGTPKGCVLSNEYFLLFGDWYRGLGHLCALEEGVERLITPLPLNHMNALACSFTAMLSVGGCVIQLDRFHPSSWWNSVRDSRATVLHYLGVMPAMLLNQPTRLDDFGQQIKFGFGAGADPRHQATFEKRFGFPLIEAWAMTETGSGACVIASEAPRHVGTRCFGRAPKDLDYRLVDENNQDVPVGTPGELLVRHASSNPRFGFFSEYLKDPTATAEAWEGGWFHTGDVVRVADDGSFHFVDRRKNIVRRSGENIAAVEVEGVLFQHEAVQNCAVAPVVDEIREEEVMACIVTKKPVADPRELAMSLAAFCRERLAYYKVPGYFAFVSDLPTTASQKVQRGIVKQLSADLIERGEAVDLRDFKRSGQKVKS